MGSILFIWLDILKIIGEYIIRVIVKVGVLVLRGIVILFFLNFVIIFVFVILVFILLKLVLGFF